MGFPGLWQNEFTKPIIVMIPAVRMSPAASAAAARAAHGGFGGPGGIGGGIGRGRRK